MTTLQVPIRLGMNPSWCEIPRSRQQHRENQEPNQLAIDHFHFGIANPDTTPLAAAPTIAVAPVYAAAVAVEWFSVSAWKYVVRLFTVTFVQSPGITASSCPLS